MKSNEAIFKTTSALLLRAPLEPGPATGAVHKLVRESIPMLIDDRVLAEDLTAAAHLISSGEVVKRAKEVVGELLQAMNFDLPFCVKVRIVAVAQASLPADKMSALRSLHF